LRDVTKPERDGMLERIDPHKLLQTYIENANFDIQMAWRGLLSCYDTAMGGKCDALLKLIGAVERLDEGQEKVSILEGKVASLREEKSRHAATLQSLERMVADEQERAQRLEMEKGVLARAKVELERRYDDANTERDAQFGILEGMVSEWETRSGRSETSSQPRGGADLEARFELIRKAFEDARMATKWTEATCKRLQVEYDDLLRKGTKMSTFSGSSGEHSNAGEGRQPRTMEPELPHQAPKDDDNAEWWAPTEPIMPPDGERLQKEVERLEGEVVRYEGRCASLQETVAHLKTRLEAQTAEAAQEKLEHDNSLDEIANSVNDIDATVSRVVAGSESSPVADSFAGSAQKPLLTQEFIREVEATQLQAIQSSRAAMDEIKAKIADLVQRISTELAEAKTAQAEEKQKYLEEVTDYIATLDSWIQKHREVEGNQGLIEDQLDALRQQVHSQQQVFHEIGRRVRQQRAQVEAAKSASRHSGTVSGRSTGGSTFHAGPDETWALRAATNLIAQLKSIAKDASMGAAARACGAQLAALLKRLRERDPDTPTEACLAELENFLTESADNGIENDKSGFHTKLDQYDRDLKSLLELEQFAPKETESERVLLIGIDEKLQAAGKLQAQQAMLIKECKAYLADHTPRPLTASQLEELVRLISSALTSTGGRWSQANLTDRSRASLMGQLVARIRRMVSDPYLAERRRELKNGIKRQGIQVEELTGEVARLAALARIAQGQMDALRRLKERGWAPSARGHEELDCVVTASQQRRETMFLRERDYSEAYLVWLDTVQADTKAFLENTAADEYYHAEKLLAETLFRLHGSGSLGPHGEATCFCTLLRFLFPKVYYSTVVGGCCAGSSVVRHDSRDAPESSCHGHHGHGVLSSSGRLWTSACRILTFLSWLILLVLIQPYNLATSARAALSLLFGMPIFVWRLVSEPETRHQFRSRDQNQCQKKGQEQDEGQHDKQGEGQEGEQKPDQEQDEPLPPPKLTLSQLPPEPATLVSVAVTVFLFVVWLSYLAVVVERQTWVANNDWRSVYVWDLTNRGPVPGTGWSPAGVDYRLIYEPMGVVVSGWAHSLFSWSRYVTL
ncbi:0dd64c92-3f07-4aa0-99ac-b24fad65a22e, partial [Staphylotrichum tortipilum]